MIQDVLEVKFFREQGSELDELDDSNSAAESIEIKWKVQDYSKSGMMVKLDFNDPISISQQGQDYVRIMFKDTTLIYDWTG